MKTAERLLGIPNFQTADNLVGQYSIPFFLNAYADLSDDAFIPKPSDWAAENRNLPSTVTENPGMWDKIESKHIADILDEVHPDSPTTHISVIKSVQSGLTVSLGENAMGFFTKYRLGSVAFFTSTKNVGKTRSNSALDVMIDNSGLDDLIAPMSNRNNRKSADTAFNKEFAGGIRWQMSSYGSIADMKSNTFNLLVCDEWDEAVKELKGQGDVAGIIEGRTMAVRMFKVLYISTSSAMETSRIYQNFIEGDQCRYFIPCPHCGEMQYMEMLVDDRDWGLTFDVKKNKKTGNDELDHKSIRYKCKHCTESFKEFHKNKLIPQGEWRPTWMDTPYTPISPKHKSYSMPGILSPFLRWSRICQQYINTNYGRDLLKYKDFTINYLGESWAKIELQASWKALKKRADNYTLGDRKAPKGALMFFGGADVQKDRIEIGILGVGKGLEKWVVDYQIFYGNPADIHDECWKKLDAYVYETKFMVEDVPVGISLVALDSGYAPKEAREDRDWESKSHVVYEFVGPRIDKFIAIKGTGQSSAANDLIREKSAKHAILNKRYDIATPIIKEMLMMIIDKRGGPNSIHVPKYRMYGGIKTKMSNEFFKQFMSERFQEVEAGKMGWKKQRARNEVWDTIIYAIAALYRRSMNIWSDAAWDRYTEELKDLANAKAA